ncbi:hypothetical protein D3C81_1426500 [compost metagenome]
MNTLNNFIESYLTAARLLGYKIENPNANFASIEYIFTISKLNKSIELRKDNARHSYVVLHTEFDFKVHSFYNKQDVMHKLGKLL